jgi:hypothetical protein
MSASGMAATTIYMAPMRPSHRAHPPGPLVIQTDLDHYDADLAFRTSGMEWRGRDHRGREILARDGALFRVKRGRTVLLRDFNGDVPQPVVAPKWACRR